MGRKVFLSFLGKYPYDELEYCFKNETYKSTFSPVASVKFLSDLDFKPDVFYVFVTKEAKENNFSLLKDELKKIKFNLNNLIPIDIENETEANKLWDNFEKVYSVLGKEDSIVFDITYGFRATPMLLTTLLNYAKVLKQVKIHKILYGAYEKGETETKLWDLTDFSTIQDLAVSTDEFINYNIPYNFIKFFDKNLQEKINRFSSMFSANRSLEIYEGALAEDLKKELSSSLSSKPRAFQELKEIIENKLSKFKNGKIFENGFNAVEFCINADLIQQAITILQELIITLLIINIEEDYKNEDFRNIVSAALSKNNRDKFDIKKVNIKQTSTNEVNKTLDAIYSLPYKKKLSKLYIKFSTSIRNDINHAGLRKKPRISIEFKEKIKGYYQEFKEILQ